MVKMANFVIYILLPWCNFLKIKNKTESMLVKLCLPPWYLFPSSLPSYGRCGLTHPLILTMENSMSQSLLLEREALKQDATLPPAWDTADWMGRHAPTRAWLMGWTHQVPPLTVAVIDTNCSCRQHWTPERRNRESDKREWGWRGTPPWRLADSAFLYITTLFLRHPPFPRATWTGFLPPAPQMPVVLTEKPSAVRITW